MAGVAITETNMIELIVLGVFITCPLFSIRNNIREKPKLKNEHLDDYIVTDLSKSRSPSLGACNSNTKPMPRHFYRPVYF